MARRVALKMGIVLALAVVLVFVLESAVFYFVGHRGWTFGGPRPGGEHYHELWQYRFGEPPHGADGVVLAPIIPSGEPSSTSWYRARNAAARAPVESEHGLIVYDVGAGMQVPSLPPLPRLFWAMSYQSGTMPRLVHGFAVLSEDGRLWCRMDVAVPFRFRMREFVGTSDDFPPSPSAVGWRTARIYPFVLAHNVAILFLLFGWPFFVGDARAAIRRRREGRQEKSKRLPRPITLRAIGVRFIVLVIGAGALAYALDAIVFPNVTMDGPAIVFSTVTEEDELWWKANMGELPPETFGPFHGPPALEAMPGTWLIPRGGHGGPGTPGRDSQRFAESLVRAVGLRVVRLRRGVGDHAGDALRRRLVHRALRRLVRACRPRPE